MLGKEIIKILAVGAGLSSLAALVYLAGPFIAIGDFRPLENPVVREIVILLLVAAAAGITGFAFWQRRKQSAEIAKGLADMAPADSDAQVLNERMKDALLTLKSAGKGKRDYLYDLPWYVLIGPPGAGKTTALANSGLKFPLSRGATPAAVKGVGGTRYCDWWFAEDAVLIDTAGRYTTQDSDARADQKSWFAFLDLLKKNRPRQPINGVIVAIALDDLMSGNEAMITDHAAAIRARLLELHKQLKVDFPVYALFTKADLVAGFREFFGNLNEISRAQVWGATFQTSDKKLNLVGDVPSEFDALIVRLQEMTTDRLQDEPVPSTRAAVFGFPAQVATLKKPVFDFLNQIFEPTRYHANATLRGFYFTSGTQEGTPIDQLIGALSRSFGAREVAANVYSGRSQSYFLKDLIGKVIIGEAAWVSTDRAAVLRARLLKSAALGVIALCCLALSLAWRGSYLRNKDLYTRTEAAVADYTATAGPLAKETEISDRDLAKILPLLNKMRYLPAGYEVKPSDEPFAAGFGLSQFERLHSASNSAYSNALERLLRPRLIYRLEEQLEANRTSPAFVYPALKVYMMLGGLHKADKEFVLNYLRQDWAENLYPGAANADGRRLLDQHVAALLDMPGQDILVSLNGPLVTELQNLLARLSFSQQAYEVLRSQAAGAEIPGWSAAQAGGPDSGLVFEAAQAAPLDTIKIQALYTYAGFRRLFIDKLAGIGSKLQADVWVLGSAGEQSAVEAQYKTLNDDLLNLYSKDFIAAWRDALNRLKLKRLLADKPKYLTLAAASAPTSPLKQLLESVAAETELTKDRPGFEKKDGKESDPLLARNNGAPGTEIEQAFKPYQILVEGDQGHRPIEVILNNLADIYQSLLMAGNPAQAALATSQLQTQVAALRTNANRLPQPFSGMLQTAASDVDGDLTNSLHAQLSRALRDNVTGICQQIVTNRYPFSKSEREVPLVDFGRLFGPQGIIDKFFSSQLAQYVDMSKPNWSWRQDNAIARSLGGGTATLKEFQRAAQIRDNFFATGGLLPSMTLTVTPPPVPVAAQPVSTAPAPAANIAIKFDLNGTPIVSPSGGSAPVVAQWPGAGANRSAIIVTSDAQGVQPSTIQRTGPWSLFRLIEAGAPIVQNDQITVSYVVGGRELQYKISAGSLQNPFTLPALHEFHCPGDI